MNSDEDEDALLRSAALENARTILEKRQQAERELLATKEALEHRSRQLARALASMQATLESTFDGILVTDGHRRVTGFNERFINMWRVPRALMDAGEHDPIIELCARQFTDPDGYRLRVDQIYAGSPRESLDLLSLADGRVFERFSKTQYLEGANAGRVWSFRDITEHHRIEAQLREQRARLEDADRRKDEFIATLAHELRNPLAPIRQAALISQSPDATAAQKRQSQEVIDRQVQYMSLLLDDLLDISRVTRATLALRLQSTDLAATVNAAIETARPMIDARRHALILELPPQPVQFVADPLRLAQVLSNLLTNAAKYTEPGGQIRLSARCEDEHLVLRVQDSGVGIHPDDLPGIFEMFSQVDPTMARTEGGLGIGLALAKGLVELHGGTIAACSDGLGHGSEFTVRLPRRLMTTADGRSSPLAAVAATVRRRILVADDNRDSAETLAMLLRIEGHDVTIAHDGESALAAFSRCAPEIALLDIGMPGINGYEVASRIRQCATGGAVKLIAVTGWGQESDKQRALAAGFDHHLTKPVDPRELQRLLLG
jgi:signal transduction histidine kinase